ncbi:MAG: hypothetical protein Q6363_001355, partial [Candidatus Njordarchaeota archaeon]
CSRAISANTKLGNYYAIERILETLIARLNMERSEDIIQYVKNIYEELKDKISRKIGLLIAEKIIDRDFYGAILMIEDALRHGARLDVYVLSILRRITKKLCMNDISKLFRFLKFLKKINETLFYSMLGVATSIIDAEDEEHVDRIMSEIFMTTLYNKVIFLSEADPSKKLFRAVFSEVLDEILAESEAISEKILYRIAVLLKSVNIDETIGRKIEHIIRNLHNQQEYNLSRLIAINYSLAIVGNDFIRSKVFLDLAINISYQIDGIISVPKIYGEYISCLVEMGKIELAAEEIKEAYEENKFHGYINMDIWWPIIQRVSEIEIIEKLEETAGEIRHRIDEKGLRIIDCIITLAKIKATDCQQETELLLNKILEYGNTFFVIKAISYLKQKECNDIIIKLADRALDMDLDTKDQSEILYAAMHSAIELKKIDEVKMIINKIRKTRLSDAREIYASLILEIATKILDADKKFSCDLLYEAYRIFESVGMRWMSLNALAILAAHKSLDNTYI